MKKDKLEDIFETLDFDVYTPSEDHESEFLKKLKQTDDEDSESSGKVIRFWKPLMAIAACLAVGLLIFGKALIPSTNNSGELASISEEMATTQNFYSTLIETELDKLEEQQTPETKQLIDDTMEQLEILESDYKKLKADLKASGQDKRVIYAMVKNFQQRTELLQTVLQTIDEINNLKTQDNESNIL